MRAPKVIPQVGERIYRYELVKKLGQGGFGVVFLARQSGLGDEVAVKILLPQDETEAQRMQVFERFRQEAEVIKRLEHPAR